MTALPRVPDDGDGPRDGEGGCICGCLLGLLLAALLAAAFAAGVLYGGGCGR